MNVTILTGRLTRKPSLKRSGDTTYTRLNLAVRNRFSKDDTPDFLTVTVFGQLAEQCAEYTVKGQKLNIRGRASSREVTLEGGATIEVVTLIGDDVEFDDKPRRSSDEEE
jgi:single-strand DNA-binding protein